MRHSEAQYHQACGCRSVGECDHNSWNWSKAIDALVDDFAKHMKSKLRMKAMEGKSGWDDPEWTRDQIKRAMIEHVDKGDPVDVANFAAFLWNRQ
jgi:hypothetical protein